METPPRSQPPPLPTLHLGSLAFGADYNPEQWPMETIDEDVDLMRQAGVTLATVGVFSWARLEPRPGEFEFAWLDHVMDRLWDAGIAIDLATATASPPAWLHHAHPEILPIDENGRTLGFGSRQAWCPSSPIVRRHQVRLVEQMADRYGDHDGVVLWHVGNEYGCHVAHCHCPVSRAAFRDWLARRYQDVDALNEAWGTAFWSQHYTSFEQVSTPAATPTHRNPGQVLDFLRFSSQELRDACRAETAVLRARTPDIPVTTNFMVNWGFHAIDYASWVDDLDLVTNDHYLDAADPLAAQELAFSADRTRGLAGGQPWLLLEHSTSAVNWQPVNVAKRTGEMARNSLAHVARGSQGAMFFQWRQSRAGAERFHSAMVPHAGTQTKVWREVVQLGRDLAALAEVADSVTEPARVAILTDQHSDWVLAQDSLPVSGLEHRSVARAIHHPLWRTAVACDVLDPSGAWDDHDVVVVPAMPIITPDVAARLEAVVQRGAHVVVTFATGLVDRDQHVVLGGYPGLLRDLLGVVVEEITPPAPGVTIPLASDTLTPPGHEPGGLVMDTWFEDVQPVDADVVATTTAGPRPHAPAITRAAHGRGSAWYVAGALRDWQQLVDHVVTEAGVEPVADVDGGIEAVRRVGPDGSWLFLLNHDPDSPRSARVRGREVLSARDVDGIELAPGGVAVVREDS